MRGVRVTAACLVVLAVVSACSSFNAFLPTPETHVVEPGDTLYSIAFRHRLDWRAIAAWNGIEPPGYLIKPGQVLRLAPPQSRAQADAPPPTASPARQGPAWRWPTAGELVSRFDAGTANGKGISIAGRPGQPIHAAADGRVVYTGSGLVGYGKLIIVKHDNRMLSAYAHNSDILVRENDEVRAGQRIATMGEAPGRRAVLHFEIRLDGVAVDPLRYLPPVHER